MTECAGFSANGWTDILGYFITYSQGTLRTSFIYLASVGNLEIT